MAELTYNEIKKNLFAKNKEKFQLEKNIQDLSNDITKAMSERNSLMARLDATVESERSQQYSDHINRCTASFNSEISAKRNAHSSLELEKRQALQSISKEEIFSRLKESAGLTEEATSGLEEVRSLVSESVGERFEKEFFNYITPRKLSFDQINLKQFVLDFRKTSDKIKRFSAPKVKGLSKVSELLDKLGRQHFEGQPKGALIFSGVLLAGFLLFSWVIFPLYVLVLVGIMASNIRQGLFYSNIIRKYKELSENLSELENTIDKAAIREYNKRVKSLEAQYDEKLQYALTEIRKAEEDLILAKRNAESSFVFDKDRVMSSHQMAIASADQRVIELDRQLKASKDRIPELEKDISLLRYQMQEVTNKVKLKYLDFSKISDELILSNDFLLDIKDDKPVMFELPYNSLLYLYDTYEEVVNFCKLILVQLRNRLSPSALKVDIWDKENMGGPFFIFTEDPKAQIFNIVSEEASMIEGLSEYKDLLSKRNSLISREFGDILKYNKAMKQIDSLTEYYKYLFLFSPSDQILNNEVFVQLLGNGPALGIYPQVFIPKRKLDKKHAAFIERIGRIFVLNNGDLDSQGRDYTLGTLGQFK